MRRALYIALILLLSLMSGKAQDIHFSQYYVAPMYFNPAFAGLSEHNIRVNLNYKSQWGTFAALSRAFVYNTFAASYDQNVMRNKQYGGYFGFGVQFNTDLAGEGNLRTTDFRLNIAYHYMFDNPGKMTFSVGLRGGWSQNRLDFHFLTFDNQFVDLVGFDNQLPGDPMHGNFDNFSYFDAGVGMVLSGEVGRSHRIYGAVSVDHFNEPEYSYFGALNEKLYTKLTTIAGGEFIINERFALKPAMLLHFQGPHTEFNIGSLLKYNVNEKIRSVHLGLWHRWQDAVILSTGAEFNHLKVSFSFDVNVSNLGEITNFVGGPEVSIQFNTNYKKAKTLKTSCPVLY